MLFLVRFVDIVIVGGDANNLESRLAEKACNHGGLDSGIMVNDDRLRDN